MLNKQFLFLQGDVTLPEPPPPISHNVNLDSPPLECDVFYGRPLWHLSRLKQPPYRFKLGIFSPI